MVSKFLVSVGAVKFTRSRPGVGKALNHSLSSLFSVLSSAVSLFLKCLS